MDVLIIGAGPAGLAAAMRAAILGARTTLVTRAEYGGMAANDGPVPVRTLAHAARLMREVRQCHRYGIETGTPRLDYDHLLGRVREVVDDVREHSILREQLEDLGVTVREKAGTARFLDEHTLETESGQRLRADRFIICAGGISRPLPVPGAELTATHSDAWSLTQVPPSLLVVGGGATGVQLASVFNAFGSRVQLFEAGPGILRTEDGDVAVAVRAALREAGIDVREGFGTIDSFERTRDGVRMNFTHAGAQERAEAALAVVAIGWAADVAGLNLAAAGVETSARGFIAVDDQLRTSAHHIFAAGDVTGRRMLVPPAMQDGFVAATNAVLDTHLTSEYSVNPIASFTDPEYAQVGLTEAEARETHDVIVAMVRCDSATRTIIDGRTTGFCKLVVDRSGTVLGCHIVGERAAETAQAAAIAIAARMRVAELARVPFSFPTYTGMLGRAAAVAAHQLNQQVGWQENPLDGA
ncbi:NAD(P)/FAD-dependent oxidoreductase [Pyxidicoccus fallax]|uniref:NAD(P)/FAD-dependent oxidoreductase n=1 Tax=Pyxidicoccus fallax TaxID=394095 RepID=A0A848L510_9BACT|nr:NAD(P)/FAD-dependent oxidoreductase [Pyxidicoccus fallax]NMO13372.1 NAD(P)/FAD-dependent oxidoreductase [Pyxidicoccus fallax]NPC78290.1 NAD(P)/FAD-dependent oxidoreductase [Pyxidicoccus fallax]